MYFVTKQPEGNVVDVDDWNGVNKSAGEIGRAHV